MAPPKRCRFTPTRVGKTNPAAPPPAAHTVHPHACGENSKITPCAFNPCGSPPRVWGKRAGQKNGVVRSRFTPTRVGKTGGKWRGGGTPPVHPHACGENQFPKTLGKILRGSPPRVWGKQSRPEPLAEASRFTPTRVGKTGSRRPTLTCQPVHPHACGENQTGDKQGTGSAGSPPRVWGKRSTWPSASGTPRFTPTRVGKTFCFSALPCVASVHPHACGENQYVKLPGPQVNGSPPRVWGKPLHPRNSCSGRRFTPTRVGKTLKSRDGDSH